MNYVGRNRLGGLVTCAVLALSSLPSILRAQYQNQIRARLEYLQQQERIILDERNWWLARIRDDNILFLPPAPGSVWAVDRFMVARAATVELARHVSAAYTAMRASRVPPPQMLMDEVERTSRDMKARHERELLPAFERDLASVRNDFNRLMASRDAANQTPRTGPPGRAWYFRRAVVGADRTGAEFQLLDYDANETGGRVQVSGRVTNMNCRETWELSWSFGGSVARLQAGQQIPVTLHSQLVSAPCPSAIGTYIGVGGSTLERVIANQAPSPLPWQGAVEETGPRAEANGTNRSSTTNAMLTVRGNPVQSNSWTYFRLQVYMPGQFWVVGYIYLAGGG